MSKYSYFVVDGPYPTRNQDGDEIPEWVVCGMNEDDDEEKIVRYNNFEDAFEVGILASKKYNVEFINEATPNW